MDGSFEGRIAPPSQALVGVAGVGGKGHMGMNYGGLRVELEMGVGWGRVSSTSSEGISYLCTDILHGTM